MGRPKGSKNATSRETETIVTPIIEVSGEVHPLKDMEENKEMPVLKSVGLARLSPNSKQYISYTITSQGDKVLNIEVSEPDLKAIAEDSAKISFVNAFMNEDGALAG